MPHFHSTLMELSSKFDAKAIEKQVKEYVNSINVEKTDF